MRPLTPSSPIGQYAIVTGNYWAFTLTDGAIRMLVVLYFYSLGYSPLQVALLFLFYEFFGVVTNLVGGWLGSKIGLNRTMNIGLTLQIVALGMLTVDESVLSVAWVMLSQALSGIAKDLNKMSAKSAIKVLIPQAQSSRLFRWVALLTGSKNALKGLGYFLGAALLAAIGFQHAIWSLLVVLVSVLAISLTLLQSGLGRSSSKPKFTEIFSRSTTVNKLSAARLFLFGARDIWFVIALPIYLGTELDWPYTTTGSFFAGWIIMYGIVQAITPKLLKTSQMTANLGRALVQVVFALLVVTAVLSFTHWQSPTNESLLIAGLLAFGIVFAVNSSLHSYFIVAYAETKNVSMDVGFYYTANAMGRLIGTVLSGAIFQLYGLLACLLGAFLMTLIAGLLTIGLEPPTMQSNSTT